MKFPNIFRNIIKSLTKRFNKPYANDNAERNLTVMERYKEDRYMQRISWDLKRYFQKRKIYRDAQELYLSRLDEKDNSQDKKTDDE